MLSPTRGNEWLFRIGCKYCQKGATNTYMSCNAQPLTFGSILSKTWFLSSRDPLESTLPPYKAYISCAAMLLFFSLAVFLSTADAICYKPTGTTQVTPDFVPCNSFNASNSYCCGAGRPSGLPSDVCMPNGLCSMAEVNETNIDTMLYWREGCSNPDWPEEVCLKNVCPDPSVGSLP